MADESKAKRFRNESRSTLSCYALRLEPGQEVRETLLKYVRDKKLAAPFVLSCVGSVTQATLRLADAARDTPNEVRKCIHLSCVNDSWYLCRMSVVSPTSRFAYKSIRLHRGRFAYRPKSFRLHDLSRFAYIQVVSPTHISRNIL